MSKRPFNRFDIQVEVGDSRMQWSSRANLTPTEMVSHLRDLAQQIEDAENRESTWAKPEIANG